MLLGKWLLGKKACLQAHMLYIYTLVKSEVNQLFTIIVIPRLHPEKLEALAFTSFSCKVRS